MIKARNAREKSLAASSKEIESAGEHFANRNGKKWFRLVEMFYPQLNESMDRYADVWVQLCDEQE